MANIVFTNFASALLAASIDDVDTTIQVATGFGDLFPVVTAPQFAYATLENDSGDVEIVKITARAALSDLLTVERGADNTLAKAFTLTVTRVELRLNAATQAEYAQVNGYTMTGDADFNGNSLIDAAINGSLTRITAGQIAGVALRGAIDLTSNEIAVPAGGGRATVGAATILASGDDIVAELDTAGVIILNSATVGVQIPAGAYLRVEGPTAANHMEVLHDDTLCSFTFPNTTSVEWDTLLNMSADLDMQDNQILQASILDFSIPAQTVAGVSTTDLDWALGAFVRLELEADIASMTFSNLPATGNVASFRLKIIQDSTPRTIAWPSGSIFPRGDQPVLTTDAGAVDYVDMWTDDGGTTWSIGFNLDWKA